MPFDGQEVDPAKSEELTIQLKTLQDAIKKSGGADHEVAVEARKTITKITGVPYETVEASYLERIINAWTNLLKPR